MTIRLASIDDARAIADIYGPTVSETAISFELEPPTAKEMARRIEAIVPAYPWIVEVESDQIVGYAYAHSFAERAAYGWSVETSIYIAAAARSKGVGGRLYSILLPILELQGYRQAFAGIALPNPASVALHERHGFVKVGHFASVGYKFGAWQDVGWWQRSLGGADEITSEPIPVTDEILEAARNPN